MKLIVLGIFYCKNEYVILIVADTNCISIGCSKILIVADANCTITISINCSKNKYNTYQFKITTIRCSKMQIVTDTNCIIAISISCSKNKYNTYCNFIGYIKILIVADTNCIISISIGR
eukprot:Pgem_evm1s4072